MYLLTLWLHGIFYYIFLFDATNFFVLRQIFSGIQVDFDVFLLNWVHIGIMSKGTLFDSLIGLAM